MHVSSLLLSVETAGLEMLVAIVNLVDQKRIIDTEHLVLKQSCVHLLVFLFYWVLLFLS